MANLNNIAASMREAFATGTPCRVPMLKGKDFAQLLRILGEVPQA